MTNVALLGSFGDVGGSPLVFRNKLINGGMAVDQRNAGATQTFTAAAALAYSVDRWYGYCTGANVTGARVAGTGSQFAYRFTGAASVTAIGFAQRIEQLNSYSLAGQTATLSVDLANSLLTTVTWTAYYANTADTFGSLASPTKTSIATGTFTVTSTVTRYQAQITVPAAATTGIEILFTVGAQTSGTWTIQNAQLEAGSSPTPFEQRPIGMELSLCQRYYEKIPFGAYFTSARSNSASVNVAVSLPQALTKRIQTSSLTLTIASSQTQDASGNVSNLTANSYAFGDGFFLIVGSFTYASNFPLSCLLNNAQLSAEL
jgi:hypothetical protein